jgi:type II secretory pathway pseudopilin PulG
MRFSFKQTNNASLAIAVLALSLGGVNQAQATIIATVGAGTAVTTVDRQATFDAVTTGVNLNGYTEDGLLISVDKTAFTGFDPTGGADPGAFSGGFHYPSSGANGGTLISTTDGAKILGVEFNVGTGYDQPTTYFAYEGFANGNPDGSGAFAITSGSVLGFRDPGGFDQLYIGAYENLLQAQSANVVTDFQAVAIDNVKVQLNGVAASPEPGSLMLMGLSAVGLIGYGWRRRKHAPTSS